MRKKGNQKVRGTVTGRAGPSRGHIQEISRLPPGNYNMVLNADGSLTVLQPKADSVVGPSSPSVGIPAISERILRQAHEIAIFAQRLENILISIYGGGPDGPTPVPSSGALGSSGPSSAPLCSAVNELDYRVQNLFSRISALESGN